MATQPQDNTRRLPIGIDPRKYGLELDDIAAEQSVDAELEAKLERYLQLKAAASEFEKLKKELKPVFEGQEQITIGRFSISGKWVDSPEKVVKAFTYWRWDIKPAI